MRTLYLVLAIITATHNKAQASKWKEVIRGEIKKTQKNTKLPADKMMKTLRMWEFNKYLEEGGPYLKSFPGAKRKKIDYHPTSILSEHQNHYDVGGIHVMLTV